ncbi:MAG: nitroreductase [Hyphomicrobiaceae bacterium]
MSFVSDTTLDVRSAVIGRKSVRGFKPDPVPLELVHQLLDEAARSPSGTNTQPWRVHVAIGAARERLVAAVTEAASGGPQHHEYAYSPAELPEPYLSRRRKVGFDLYGLAGIARNDMEGRKRQALKNYTFFGAPVGLFFTVEKRLERGSWLDIGMLMQTVMLLARGYGLETCPQAAWIYHGPTVHKALGIPDDEYITSGMALGYPDWTVAENALETVRAPASEFVVVQDK